MIIPIILYGDPILRKKCKYISEDYLGLESLIQNMFDTMSKAYGIGLAAPQIGLLIRLFVIDAGTFADEKKFSNETCEVLKNFKRVCINPKITRLNGFQCKFKEGCLSMPGIHESIARESEIKIEYYDKNWEKHIESLTGLPARIIQHEFDHIEGKLFIDYLPAGPRKRIIEKYKKRRKKVIYLK